MTSDRSGASTWLYVGGVLALACAWPFLSFVDANRGEIIDVPRILLAFAATALATTVLFLVLRWTMRGSDPRRLAVAVATGVLCFFAYGAVFGERSTPVAVSLVLWAVLTALLVIVLYRYSSSANVRTFAAIFLAVLVLVPGAGVVASGVDTPDDEVASGDPVRLDLDVAEGDKRPNVYWLVFDEYGRADQLASVLDFDNQPMVDELEGRGFVVPPDRYTSYPVTALALSSVMAMDYVATDEADLEPGPTAWTQVLRGPSPVVDTFDELGYEHLYAETGLFTWNRCDPDHSMCLGAEHAGWAPDELALALLDLTPLGALDLAKEGYVDPVRVVEEAQAWGVESGKPFFVSAHILSPHEPYWFRDDCTRRADPVHGLDPERHVHELECLNQEILKAVDLIEENDPGAVVVLQSDHGSKILGDWDHPLDEWTDEAIEERFAVFEAMRVPAGCDVPPGPTTTINTFRIVFACIDGSEPELLDYRAFMWRHPAPEELIELDVPPGTGDG